MVCTVPSLWSSMTVWGMNLWIKTNVLYMDHTRIVMQFLTIKRQLNMHTLSHVHTVCCLPSWACSSKARAVKTKTKSSYLLVNGWKYYIQILKESTFNEHIWDIWHMHIWEKMLNLTRHKKYFTHDYRVHGGHPTGALTFMVHSLLYPHILLKVNSLSTSANTVYLQKIVSEKITKMCSQKEYILITYQCQACSPHFSLCEGLIQQSKHSLRPIKCRKYAEGLF